MMLPRSICLTLSALAMLTLTAPLPAQNAGPTADQLKSWTATRQQRVDVLRDEIKQLDKSIESRLDLIVDSLKSITDSKDSRTKVARMKDLGARVHLAGRDFDDAKAHARAHAAREGVPFVEDGREKAIAEGAGSIAVELLAWPEPIDTAVIPLGNGALLGGIGAWFRHASPGTRIVGVCAAAAPAMRESLRAGRVIETKDANTIADGIAVRVPIPEALDYLAPLVDEVVLVSESSLRQAMSMVLDTTGLVGEPAGVAGIAALIEHEHLRSGLVATPLCGSNQ